MYSLKMAAYRFHLRCLWVSSPLPTRYGKDLSFSDKSLTLLPYTLYGRPL